MLAVTGATGKLGQLVVAALLQQLPPGKIVFLSQPPDSYDFQKSRDQGNSG